MRNIENEKSILQSKKVAIINLGCKVNKYESDAMANKLQAAGMQVVLPEDVADVYIINTCSVTNMAQKKSRQMLRRAKKNNPNAIIIAAGCYVNAEHDVLRKEDFVDILVGNNCKKDIVTVVEEALQSIENRDYYLDIAKEKEYEEMGCLDADVMDHQRAYIKIQDGCNQFCSYCIIPYTRGRVRSRDVQHILDEITRLAEDGIREFVLTGIHISSFGVDLPNGENLADLILQIAQIEKVDRIRLGSLEPRIITDEFLGKVVLCKKLCPHFHLSLQSACNDTLKRMNRKYTIEEFMDKCRMLRQAFDKPAITTDVIVGFPGETKEEFECTISNLEELNLYEIHVFKYSIREGTVAQRMPDHVAETVKNERSDRLLALTARQKENYEESLHGYHEQVLVEEMIKENVYVGHSTRYTKVELESAYDIVNQIIDVVL